MSAPPPPPGSRTQSWRIGPIERRGIVIRAGLALALVVLALLTNRSYLGWGLFAIFAILFVPVTRARSFLFSFVPYATVWFVFTFMRSLADETVLARTMNIQVFQFERWLFGGQIPTIMLQDRLYKPGSLHWWDYVTTAVHWSYFIVPHAVAIRLWQKHPQIFRQFLAALTLLLGIGLAVYFLIPTNPPWLAPEPVNSPSAAPVYRIMEQIGEQLGGGLYTATYRVVGESNPIAAMPSIHTAITALLMFPAFRLGRRWFIASVIYTAAMGYTLVYTGEHYVIDVAMGITVAAAGWFGAGAWRARLSPYLLRMPPPLPGTAPTVADPATPAAD
jgi:membrane-associated phospholipid phosphatase